LGLVLASIRRDDGQVKWHFNNRHKSSLSRL
jgi:hypothetical protein